MRITEKHLDTGHSESTRVVEVRQNRKRDSRLVRVYSGQLLPVVEPRHGLSPEDRYQFAAPGQGELGKGAIGQVQLVFDTVLGREVAMKVLRDEYAGTESDTQDGQLNEATWRFLREARVTGQLEHPNIVPVHELGCREDGTVYYTMRVVRGRTLGDALNKARNLKQRLALLHHFGDLCHAIAYAHSRGVLHRDIKPSNVMIGEFGETFVLDWGLARVTKPSESVSAGPALSLPPNPRDPAQSSIGYEDHERTRMGGIVGTPQYMSPEQILGNHDDLDPRADVWSLGVVLYILLTGRSPFTASTMQDILAGVLTKDITPPIDLEPSVPVELQAIVLRALKRDRTRRYKDAGEMARDVTAYQSGERVEAYDYKLSDLARRFLSRYRAAAAVSAVALCVFLSLAVTSYFRIAKARDAAVAAERRATTGQQQANSRLAEALIERSRSAASADDVIEAELLAAEASATEAHPSARGMLVSLASSIRLVPNSNPAALGKCSQLVARARSDKLLCLEPESLKLFRGPVLQWARELRGAVSVTPLGTSQSAVLASDGTWVAYSDSDGSAVASGQVPLVHPAKLIGSDQQSWLAATDTSGNVAVWDSRSAQAKPFRLHWTQAVTALSFTHGHGALVLGGKLGRISIWDFEAGEQKETDIGESHTTVEAVVVGQRHGLVISGGSDGTVSIHELARRRLLGTALQRPVGIASLALSEQGRWLLVGTRNSEVDLVDMQQRARVFAAPRAVGPLSPLGFDQNGNVWLVNGASEIARYEVVEPTPRTTLLDRSNVLGIAWSPGSDHLFSGGLRDAGICLFRLADGACVDRIPINMSQVRVVTVSPNGRYLLLAGSGGTIQVWDAASRLPITVAQVPVTEIRAAAFDGSQHNVYVGGVATRVFKVSLDSGKLVDTWDLDGQVQAMALAHDSHALVLGFRDGRVQRRDEHGHLLTEARIHQGWVSGIGLHPRLRRGLSIGADGVAHFWNAETLQILTSHRDHTGRATAVAWSPDGKYVATGGEDQNLNLYSGAEPWTQLAQWQGHRGTVRCLAFDPTSRWLASGGDDANVRLWIMQAQEADPKTIQSRSGAPWGVRLVGARVVRH